MAEVAAQFSIGAPVEVNEIDRELKKLWATDNGAITRASLVNLAVYSEKPDSLAQNTQVVSQITQNHACRALVIEADPRAANDRAQAWISAHCHLRASARQVCSEQISFRLEGTKLFPSILFSHLDSDLPLYLWWQAELREPLDPQLWAWVDRLIYDSRDWRDFDAQMRLIEAAQEEGQQRQMVLCDLNWSRLLHFRLAFAQFFDHPASHCHFDKSEKVSLAFGRGFRPTGLLFLGWIAAQLGWEVNLSHDELELENSTGKFVIVELSENGEAPLIQFTARTPEVEFCVKRADCGDLLEVSYGKLDQDHVHQLLPADDGDLATLVSEELMRGGDRHVYGHAVEKVRALL